MRKLDKPTEDPADVFRLCFESIRAEDLKERMREIEPDILDAASAFDQAVTQKRQYALSSSDSINPLC